MSFFITCQMFKYGKNAIFKYVGYFFSTDEQDIKK